MARQLLYALCLPQVDSCTLLADGSLFGKLHAPDGAKPKAATMCTWAHTGMGGKTTSPMDFTNTDRTQEARYTTSQPWGVLRVLRKF